MKPLSEKLKEIPLAHYTTQLLLQAWLREADEFLEPEKVVTVFPSENERSMDVSKFVSRIRRELLGTTQKPKQEGKK
jgi:hypothetical protein